MTRLLVTGASGLLGGCVLRQANDAWQALGTAHRRTREGLVPLDIRNADAVAGLVRTEGVTHIVHCAALRSPDYCIEHPDEAEDVNVDGTRNVAAAARAVGAHLLYVSTDYVFPGTHPPYDEDASPDPINLYGRTKLGGEGAALAVERHTIARIPALYRIDLGDPRSYVTELAGQLAKGNTLRLDAETVRYYTLADEVAAAFLHLLARSVRGVVHLSA
ncbi:MAG: dTDP-4-dehydrorhamnose reductase family protein, partial [Planctomycetota bacterium]